MYELVNSKNVRITLLKQGASLQSIFVPDKNGKVEDVLLGYDTEDEYWDDTLYAGGIVGRVANRISGAQFELEGKTYQLFKNAGENHLHGGKYGFNKLMWKAKEIKGSGWVGLEFSLLSPNKDECYPGELRVKVTYKLTENNELIIDYKANTTKATPVNLTNHAYFNLSGKPEFIGDHEVKIIADKITVTDADYIPSGKFLDVKGTDYDLNEFKNLAEAMKQNKGFDDNFCLSDESKLKHAAEVQHPESGRKMTVYTTKPGIQFYTGNSMAGAVGKSAVTYENQQAFCLETQFYPDSVNRPEFPSIILQPEETYIHKTIYKFDVME